MTYTGHQWVSLGNFKASAAYLGSQRQRIPLLGRPSPAARPRLGPRCPAPRPGCPRAVTPRLALGQRLGQRDGQPFDLRSRAGGYRGSMLVDAQHPYKT